MLPSLSVLHERPDTKVSNTQSEMTMSFHVLISGTFFIFNIDCCFASTCIYEVLHYNGIFLVNDAKAQPRLNTGPVLSKTPHTMAKVTV